MRPAVPFQPDKRMDADYQYPVTALQHYEKLQSVNEGSEIFYSGVEVSSSPSQPSSQVQPAACERFYIGDGSTVESGSAAGSSAAANPSSGPCTPHLGSSISHHSAEESPSETASRRQSEILAQEMISRPLLEDTADAADD